MKRFLSFLLALVMVFTLVPMQVFAAEAATITVAGNYSGKYIVISDGSSDKLYYIGSGGTVQNADGTEATFAPGTYTLYYGIGGSGGWGNASSFATGTVTLGDTDATVRLSTARVSSGTAYATKKLYATSLFYNTSSFDHVDVRVAGSYVIHIGSQAYEATVSNPSVTVKVGSNTVASKTWSGTTSYEWRQTGLRLTKASVITVELVLDLTYTDSTGKRHTLEDVQISYDSVNNIDKFIDAIAICDMVQGLDFRVSVEDIEEEIQYHSVSYEWRVYNTDGSYTQLPAGAPNEPAATSGHAAGEQYVYDTEYVTGTSFYDYDKGLLYTFHGWDTYSHSAQYNPIPSSGYHALDDGDTNAANNPTIEITADTYIYGYWTVTELEPASAHIAIEKIFLVDGVEMTLAEAEDLWFRVDTGIDRDGDGDTLIDVDYTMLAATGEYKIPVYQYDTPFVFTELGADVPGYKRTTTIAVAGDHIVSSTQNGDSVSVTMDPVYQGENVHLGTVTYTNSYTKDIGAPVHIYPTLTLLKSATDTHLAQEGVGFTLYSDAACTAAVAEITTGSGGIAYLDFSDVENAAPGTYYLKETAPLSGYKADPYVYAITLAVTNSKEELRDGQYVQVTHYSLSVAVPEGSTASYQSGEDYYRLHIYNEPVLGSLALTKAITGLADADEGKLRAVVIVHGPISRGSDGSITGIGNTWQLELSSENGFAASLEALALGEYLIHESFASVHGYTWTGVTYGDLETVLYNGITSGVFTVEDETAVSLTLHNTYEEWAAADFYIKKIDDTGKALPGAVFRLSTDPEGLDAVATVTTGADGYAHFDGFDAEATYYLREVQAPAGYYLSDQLYKVVISAVTADGKTAYEPIISLVAGRSSGFDINTDLLTVTNFPVLGQLTVTKAFAGGVIPEGLTGVAVQIGGPNGYLQTVTLSNENGWSVTLEGLTLGEYTVYELDANVPGYTWDVAYSAATVTLTEENPGQTAYGTVSTGAVTVTNSYSRNEEFFEVPTSLTVKKVGDAGELLPGAVFTLERLDAEGAAVSFTTGQDGTVVFDLLSGIIDQDGTIREGKYLLTETAAPEGYEKTDTTWTVTVKEDDGNLRVVLNENKNVFEGFWDWVVGEVSPGVFENGVLTVTNTKKLGKLTVTKEVVDPEGRYENAEYAFTLDSSDDAFDRAFTLKAGETFTLTDIPWGTAYTLTEDTAGAAFTGFIADGGNGLIWAEETAVTVTNTYAYELCNEPLALVKVDAQDSAKFIAGAGFTLFADEALTEPIGEEVLSDENGSLALPIEAPGTYYLAETTTPTGYHSSDAVYTVTAEEIVTLKDAGTADAVTEIRMQLSVQGLTQNAEGAYLIENTPIKPVTVSAQKVWYGADVEHPGSVSVTLYRDGEAYDTVTLSASNDWSHTWKDLTDEFQWEVDEPSVPSGYNKTVRQSGYSFTVINTYEDIPKTGGVVNLLGYGAMTGVGILGFGASALALITPRRKKEEEA